MSSVPRLDLGQDVVALTESLCNIPSVSLAEGPLADALEAALRALPHLSVTRDGDAVVARTELGRAERVVLAGHLDTVPLTDPPNLPVRREGGYLVGRGTTDMKGGVAVQLCLAATLPQPNRDITFVFYDAEEISDEHNGLARLARQHPELLAADFAVLLEPTDDAVEGGCNGNVTALVHTRGRAAHSARPWMGHNAIHDLADVLARIERGQLPDAEVDGLVYRQSLNAVGISGGIAHNVIPDHAVVTVNLRFAPRWDADRAVSYLVDDVFAGLEVEIIDRSAGARPGLQRPAAADFVRALGLPVRAKQGWTDVARFSALGVPAVNFGPGESQFAHADDERCQIAQIVAAQEALTGWLA
ncbi:succinyl-diaminopimelate desuccinylase [Ornithinimicrobium sp. F0845]|uniref:succinyl-diaminopimelate desuccinylase n=1 Tax=Ornithinimicrobium sp. F0845 TaxID=2926412 RepID=UPI001FF199AF|nr:succinyl-diaminopimelate desuccinylase [Ornithinimicrobium sp. F0845]MCK0111060.1 succinyl-diaminopimelate desuccinylase [Ornithinimicrobium sp. F0845]